MARLGSSSGRGLMLRGRATLTLGSGLGKAPALFSMERAEERLGGGGGGLAGGGGGGFARGRGRRWRALEGRDSARVTAWWGEGSEAEEGGVEEER